jgi:hypothetical protein
MTLQCCCVIGPTKSGTTLMGCLLDSHPELAIFPLEVKFFTHWLERLRYEDPTYAKLNLFFLEESKLRFLSKSRDTADIMNSGRIDPTCFNFQLLRRTMIEKEREGLGLDRDDLFRKYTLDIHSALPKCAPQSSNPTLFISKEGNHGLPHSTEINNLFPTTKFIVLTRDPRDIFVSMKTIAEKKRDGVHTPTFKADISPMRYIVENPGKNVRAYEKLSSRVQTIQDVHFVKYESLVTDTVAEMQQVAKFLDIEFVDCLCKPTVFGRPWGGNASNARQLPGVTRERSGKWERSLTKKEIRVLEFFLKGYLIKSGYQMSGLSTRRMVVAWDIVLTNYNAWTVTWGDGIRPLKQIAKNIFGTMAGLIACFRKS